MLYTVYVNNELKKVSALSVVEKIDKTLDYGSIQFRDQVADSYKGYVDIGVSDGVNTRWYYFLIAGDDSEFIRDGYYLHKLDLIELTYLLNEFTESTRVLTQTDPPETAYQTMLKWQHTIPFTRFEDMETSRAFVWDDATEDYFQSVSLPEMKLDRKNLHEMLQQAFEYFDAIPRLTKVNDYLVLKADFVNKMGNLIVPKATAEMERFNINEYATNLDLHLENLYDRRTSVVEPSPNGFKPLDGKDGLYKEETAFINTEFPILDIEELVVKVEVFDEATGQTNEYYIDLKPYILEKTQWELLTDAPSFSTNFGTFRDNTLFFTRYQRGVDGLFDEVGAWRGVSVIQADIRLRRVITKALLELGETPTGRIRLSDFTKVRVRIRYKAIVNSRVSVQKDDVSEINRKASLFNNQSDQVVDSELVLDNNYKRIQQMGNPEFYFVQRDSDLTKMFELGDYLGNGYKVTEVERMFLKDFVVNKYKMTKLYQKVSEFIGLKNEIRDFPMPNDRYQRSVHYVEHLEVDDNYSVNDSLLNATAMRVLFNPFYVNPDSNWNKPINAFVFNNEVVPDWDPEVYSIVKPATKFAGGNSMTFKFKFDDVKVGGDQKSVASEEADLEVVTDEQTGVQRFFSWGREVFLNVVDWVIERTNPAGRNIFDKPILKGVFYTDGDGRVYDFTFNLVHDFEIEDETKLPLVRKADLGPRYLEDKEFRVYLEPAEILELSYTVNISSLKPEKFIVGKYFVGNNGLVKQGISNLDQYEVVESSETYARNENKYGKGTVVPISYSTFVNQTYASFVLTSTTDANSWAIRHKESKELVIAVNQLQPDDSKETIDRVFFTPRKLKTGQVYANQPTFAILYLTRPYGFFVLDTVAAQLYVAWSDDNQDVDFFEVGISKDLENWETVEITAQNYTFTGLDAGTEYTIRVRTHRDGEVSEYAYITGTTKEGVPTAPANASAVSYSSTRIIVTWDDLSADEYAFEVNYSQDSGNFPPAQSKILSKDTTIWSHNGLEPGQTWYYRVRARGNGGNSAWSNIAQASTPEPDKVSTPSIDSLSVSGSTLSYTLRNTHDQFVRMFADVDTLNPSTVVNSQMPPNTTYSGTVTINNTGTFYARAEAIFVQQTPSDVTSQNFIVGSAPIAPTITTMERISASEIRVQWSYIEAADGYYIRLMQGGTTIVPETPLGKFIVVRNFTGLTAGLTYTFYVRAYNEFGESTERSRSLLLTADEQPPLAPDQLTVEVPSSKTFRLNWRDNSSNETGFVIEWGSTSSYGNVVNVPANTTTWDVFTNATGSFFIRIKAVNDVGSSAYATTTIFIAF